MKNSASAIDTERIFASTVTQAQALFPSTAPATIRADAATHMYAALAEAYRLHPKSPNQRMAYVHRRTDEAILLNLATIGGTRH